MTIWVSSLASREDVLKANNIRLMISLISPDADSPEMPYPLDDHLIIRFHDINEPRKGLVLMNAPMLDKLFDFDDRYQDQDKLIHCFAGISRSTAAAYCLKARQAKNQNEFDLAKTLRRLSPTATPNQRLVALADARLNRQGRMLKAIQSIGRGAEAFSGEPFYWG